MKSSELRIGNYVKGDTDGVYQIKMSDFADWYNDHNSHEFGNHIHPIPLTEEWILKFGFVKRGLWYKKDGCFILGWMNMDKEVIVGMNRDYSAFYKTVHQLQNLYFALTNTELCVK